MKTAEYLKNLDVNKIKNSDPKDFITLMSHALRLGALYKAKFFMWLENNNYEMIAQDEEILEHFIKELIAVHKKAEEDVNESNTDFIDNIFYTIFKNTGKFQEADCISLSLVLMSFISFKTDLITNEEYLEIRDLLVPYKVMISQCKINPDKLFKMYKESVSDFEGNTKLISKLGKGVEVALPDESIILEGLKEITYDEKSWEKE